MLKKIISAAVFAGLAVALPLLGKPHLMLHWRVLVLVATIALLMLTQPALRSPEETAKDDRHTLWLIMGLSLVSVATPLIEWAWFSKNPESPGWSLLSALGLGLIVGGSAFRLWAIVTLGRWFTSEVKIQDGQPLITSGPYRLVRHPSYLGAYLAFWGVGLLFEAPVGLALAAAAMFWAYRHRIAAEEVVLERHFGAAWEGFSARRKRLVPLVW